MIGLTGLPLSQNESYFIITTNTPQLVDTTRVGIGPMNRITAKKDLRVFTSQQTLLLELKSNFITL